MAGNLSEALQELQVTNGLDMAAVVSADGLVVESAANDEIDVDSVCSVASNGLLMMEAVAQELDESQADLITIEFPDHILIMSPIDSDYLLVLLAGAGMNLGRMRIALRRRLGDLSQALATV